MKKELITKHEASMRLMSLLPSWETVINCGYHTGQQVFSNEYNSA